MFLLEQVVNGLVLGGYYLLIALGLLGVVGAIVHLLRKLQAAKSIQGAAAATAELRQAGTDDGVK